MNDARTRSDRGSAAPVPRRLRGKIAAGVLATVIGTVLIAITAAEWRYGFLRTGPRVDRSIVAVGSGVIAVVDPVELEPLARDEIRASMPWRVPDWVLRRMLPHDGGVAAALNLEQQRVDLRVYVNPKSLAPVARRLGGTLKFSTPFPRIRWKKGAEEPLPGLLVKEGVVPFAPEAEDAFWYTWNQTIEPAPLVLEGGHLFEAIFDNRQGHAFLIVASLLETYDIELGAEETDISLSSLQFVHAARLSVDLAPGDSLRIRFTLEIMPEHIEKLGVVNLKVGLDDVFAEYSERWKQDHGLRLEGHSAWDGTRVVYDYRLSSAREAFHLLVLGELD